METEGSQYNYIDCLEKVELKKLGHHSEAGLWITSLPVPADFPVDLSFEADDVEGENGIYLKELGQWPNRDGKHPRRLLMVGDGANFAPEALRIARYGDKHLGEKNKGDKAINTPQISMELFEECSDPAFAWERHMARISWGNKSIGLLMGLRTKDTVHWWEACKMVILEETPTCRVVEIGGAIPLVIYNSEDMAEHVGYRNSFLHKHNWLNGNIYARLHSNGVCEIFAHHVNSKFFDDGLDLEDAVPVIGFKIYDEQEKLDEILGPWNGDRDILDIGNISFDMSDARHLATDKKPGQFSLEGDFLIWQPYEGCELYGGAAPIAMTGDGYIFKSSDKVIPRGMARTTRFSFSLSDRSPRVMRYIAPPWWYGICEEFLPEALLPVSNEYDKLIEGAREYIKTSIVKGGFEDGSVPRHIGKTYEDGRYEPGWEGEMPGGQFLCAWRTGDAEDYDHAMRSAYVFTDVYVDHATKAVRMHGFPPTGVSVPMNRVHGTVLAYLETGDPYLFKTACAVIDNSYWSHKNSWPRLCVGRDACFIRGAVMLYRYFNSEHYRKMAEDAIKDVIVTQRPDGSFGDQGGGTGIHQWAAYITKPWMGLMAMGGVVDYLELFPDEPKMLEAVKKFGDWLMEERFDHEGIMGWSYQHYFKDGLRYKAGSAQDWIKLKESTDPLWHVEYLARFLGFCSITFKDPAYLDAWAESYSGAYDEQPKITGDHAAVQIFQYIPWLQAKLWNARLIKDGVVIDPIYFGEMTPTTALIMAPDRAIEVSM